MRPHFRLKKITAYPDWHKKPFRLNRAEMTNPHTVIQEFFDRYDLINIRIAIKKWLDDALRDDTEAPSHVYTHENIEKLIEATWVIWQQRKQAEADEGIEKKTDERVEEIEIDEKDGDKEERRRFVKWIHFPASLKANPVAYMKRVFEIIDMTHLKEIIKQWQRIALTTEGGNYEEAGERTDLMDFCEGLYKLVEITYSLQRKMEWEDEERVKRQLSEELKHELLLEEQVVLLSDEEIANPQTVLKAFFDVFSVPYSLRELWDMLDSAIACKQEGFDKTDLLLEYECLRAVLEASWLLHNNSKNDADSNKKEMT